MSRVTLCKQAGTAFVLSLAGLLAAVGVEGVLLFRGDVAGLLEPLPVTVRRYFPCSGGRAAVVAFVVWKDLPAREPTPLAGVYDLSAGEPTLTVLPPWLAPWQVVSDRQGRWAFAGTQRGDLYALDLDAPHDRPVLMGNHDHCPASHLECTADGSLVVAAARTLAAWDGWTRRLVWRRSGLDVTSIAFLPGTRRLLCGLYSGQVLELSPTDGSTVREIFQHDWPVSGLAVSPDGRRLAVHSSYGRLTVIEPESGRTVWSVESRYSCPPRFSADGSVLVTVDSRALDRLVLMSADNGSVIASIETCGRDIKGLAVAADNTVYCWHMDGTISAVPLNSRKRAATFRPQLGGSLLAAGWAQIQPLPRSPSAQPLE